MADLIPGEYLLQSEPIDINAGRATRRIEVSNTGDRPVQVGSHYHFFEVNRYLTFDRPVAYGMRLNIAAGTAARFEPGDTREVELVDIGGSREIVGLNRLVEGRLDDDGVKQRALGVLEDYLRPSVLDTREDDGPSVSASGGGAPRENKEKK